MFPKVSIIILNWNGKADTRECLDSLKQITYPNYEIILVDNGSTDGSIECFKKMYSEMEIIENKKNLGFAEGNNVGIRRVIERGTNYVLILNNDTIVAPDFLIELVKVAETDESIGIVGPIIYNYNTNIIQSAGIKLRLYNGKIANIGYGQRDRSQFNSVEERYFLTGCVILVKTDLLNKIDGFDPAYFAYWEDTDLCVRARKNNYHIYFTPKSKVWHKGSKSTGGYLNDKAYYYYIRNSIYFYYKNYPRLLMIYGTYIVSVYLVLLIGYSITKKRLGLVKSFIKGLTDSFSLILQS